MTNQQKWKELSARLDEIEAYGRCIGKVNFDMECCAPEEGLERAGEDMALLGKRLYKLTHAKRYAALLEELHADAEGLSEAEKKAVEHLYDDHARIKNVSAALDYKVDLASNKAYAAWLKAKKANDFSLFRDALGEMIAFQRTLVQLRDERRATVYDSCLDDMEKGGGIAQLDAFFAALRARIVPLLERVVKEGKPIRADFLLSLIHI